MIDLETKKLYAVAWTSSDGSVAKAVHELHEVDITSGQKTDSLRITANAPGQVPTGQKVPTFDSPKQKQRAALLLTTVDAGGQATKVLLVGCGMTHEEGDPTHGWLMAFEVARARRLLDEGAPLVRTLTGRPALAVAAFVAGGRAALDAIARAGYDVLAHSPRPSRIQRATALARTIAGSHRGP